MLSQAFLVTVKTALEKTYIGNCTVTEQRKVKGDDKTTEFEEVVVYENIPCRLTFKKFSNTIQGDIGNALEQTVKVFISPDISILAGSRLDITQN